MWAIVLVLTIVSCTQTGGTVAKEQLSAPPSNGVSPAEDDGWPRGISTAKGVVVIYQPQPEKLDGDQLTARAAVSIELKGGKEPVLGAVWMDSRLDTDRVERTSVITEVSITNVRLPEQYRDQSKELSELLEREIPKWSLPISMDRLLASLDLADVRTEASRKINNDPPRIIFSTKPAVLISIDGDPRLRKEEGADLMRVVNTPFTILLDSSSSIYYLNADADTWYESNNLMGKWSLATQVPNEIADRAPRIEADPGPQPGSEDDKELGPPPEIIVATEPAELIVSEGEPELTPIEGTDLLYMSNSDSDVLLHVPSQQYYVLLAGRWYLSRTLEGPWSHVEGKGLPKDFSKIPEESDMATVLYAVPATEQSREAVLDAYIPQTAKIDRNQATLKIEYDGEAMFEPVTGTNMRYAVNADTPVIQSGGKYYAVDNGVWFVADNAAGPWQVATSVPTEIYTIEPDSPLYPVTFVRIYKVTPEYVYVGYTPGYTNTYVYDSTIVYGTGYWYPGWYGRYYYPRPATWGFGVRWNPWTGWGFGFSYSYGPFTFGVGSGGWHRGGWWGPSRYHGYRRGYRHGYRHGYYSGYRASNYRDRRQNLYNNHGQARVAVDRSRANVASASIDRSNNVYTDRRGETYRNTDRGWQARGKDGWEAKSAYNTPSYESLNRSSQARQRGTQRVNAYRQSRGGSRGGRRRGP